MNVNKTFEKVLNKLVVPQFDKIVKIEVQSFLEYNVKTDIFLDTPLRNTYHLNFYITSPISSDERTEIIEASYSVFRMIGIEDSKFRFKFEFH